MKKTILLFCFGLCALGLQAQATFRIEGHVPVFPDGTDIQLTTPPASGFRIVESTKVSDGKFSLEYDPAVKTAMGLLYTVPNGGPNLMTLWVEPGGTATITQDEGHPAWLAVESTVPEQKEYNRYLAATRTESLSSARIAAQLRALTAEMQQGGGNDTQQKIDSLQTLQVQCFFKLYEKNLSVLEASEPSLVFLNQLYHLAGPIAARQETMGSLKERVLAQYLRLPPELTETPEGIRMRQEFFPEEVLRLKGPMIDAELPDLAGTLHKLSDYRGKYILLDFWASWCGPCIRAFPELREVTEKYRDRITLIGLNSDREKDWRAVSERLALSWLNLNIEQTPELAARYGVSGIPHQVLISPEGEIIDFWRGYREGEVEETLKKYIPGLE